LKFVNDVKYTSFVEVGGEILQLNTSTIMFEPGQMKEITIVANISSWLRFGTYKGVLSALAQASNE
jgi:urease beta subunit